MAEDDYVGLRRGLARAVPLRMELGLRKPETKRESFQRCKLRNICIYLGAVQMTYLS